MKFLVILVGVGMIFFNQNVVAGGDGRPGPFASKPCSDNGCEHQRCRVLRIRKSEFSQRQSRVQLGFIRDVSGNETTNTVGCKPGCQVHSRSWNQESFVGIGLGVKTRNSREIVSEEAGCVTAPPVIKVVGRPKTVVEPPKPKPQAQVEPEVEVESAGYLIRTDSYSRPQILTIRESTPVCINNVYGEEGFKINKSQAPFTIRRSVGNIRINRSQAPFTIRRSVGNIRINRSVCVDAVSAVKQPPTVLTSVRQQRPQVIIVCCKSCGHSAPQTMHPCQHSCQNQRHQVLQGGFQQNGNFGNQGSGGGQRSPQVYITGVQGIPRGQWAPY